MNEEGCAVLLADGDLVTLKIPLQLNNTDYFHRVLSLAHNALIHMCQEAVTCAAGDTGGELRTSLERPGMRDDLQSMMMIMHYIIDHSSFFAKHLALSRGAVEEFKAWFEAAGRISIKEVLQGVTRDRLKEAFLRAIALANATGQKESVKNLQCLQAAWLENNHSKPPKEKQHHGLSCPYKFVDSENQPPMQQQCSELPATKTGIQGSSCSGAKPKNVLAERREIDSNVWVSNPLSQADSRRRISEALRHSRDLGLVLGAMDQHQMSAAIQEQGCHSVADIVSGDMEGYGSNVGSGESASALRHIQQAMQLHPESEGVQTEAFGAVAALCSVSEAAATEAGKLGLLADIQAAMEDHLSSVALQEQGCEVIRQIAAGLADNAERAGEQGMLETIQAAMEAHEASPAVQQYGCMALRSLAAGSTENIARAGEQGLLETVQAAMRAHRCSEQVQQQAVWAIRAVTSGSEANQRVAEDLGLLEDIRAGMEAHRGSPAVQQGLLGGLGRQRLGNLQPSPLKEEEEEGEESRDPRHNGLLLDTIQQTMRSNRNCVAVQERACATIRIIANSEDPSAMKGTEDILEDLQEAMRLHPGSEAIQQQALGALGASCANRPENAARAGALGLLEDAREAMRLHPGSVAVQHEGCEAIATVIGNAPDLRPEAARLGLLSTIQAAMRSHRGSAHVQEWACTAVWDITAADPTNRAYAGKLGLLSDVQIAMRNHRGHRGVQEEAFWCIRNVTVRSKANQALARRLRIGDDIQAAAAMHPEQEAIQSLAAGALCDI